MARLIATCGHDISREWNDWDFNDDANPPWDVIVKDWTREGERCVSFQSKCIDCRSDFYDRDLLIISKEDAKNWLGYDIDLGDFFENE